MVGVLILTPATLLSKLIGLFYKVPLLRIVGVEGMAYFLSAYHIYSLLFVLAAAGLPTALSILVARLVAKGERGSISFLFGVATALFLVLGTAGFLLLWRFSEEIANALSMRDAALSLAAISPALLFAALVGAVRGLFQGHGNMLPTAVSEVVEACGKLVFGVLFASRAAQSGAPVPVISAAAVFGITVGMALSALVLLVWLFLARQRLFDGHVRGSLRGALGELVRVALPITVGALVTSLVSLVDTALISSRLQALGYAPPVANALYSTYGNLAVPLYNLVPALLSPVMLSLTPVLSAAFATKERGAAERAFSSGLRLIGLVALPASLGLAAFAEPILRLIYGGEEAVAVAAPLLAVLAPAVLLAAFVSLFSAALQAAGHPAVPFFAMLLGGGVKLGAELLLLLFPSVHIFAAPISTIFCNFAALAVLLGVLLSHLPHLCPVRELMPAFFAALAAIAAGLCIYTGLLAALGDTVLIMPAVLVATVPIYVIFALVFRAFYKEDLQSLPFGERLLPILEKKHLLREVENDDKRGKAASDLAKTGI